SAAQSIYTGYGLAKMQKDNAYLQALSVMKTSQEQDKYVAEKLTSLTKDWEKAISDKNSEVLLRVAEEAARLLTMKFQQAASQKASPFMQYDNLLPFNPPTGGTGTPYPPPPKTT